jgi:molybdate transport system substrate-binding protein
VKITGAGWRHRRSGIITVIILLSSLAAGCARQPAAATDSGRAPEITIAAAANLADALDELGRQFTSRTGIEVKYSLGSTADLARQIENNAPFDVFAAADAEHLAELDAKGLIAPGTRALYARGRLVLWVPRGSPAAIQRLEDVAHTGVRNIAVAKPELAPYGQATVDALQSLRLWSQVEPKVVYGQNVSQARQFAATGNAEAAFIPRALVKDGDGLIIEVDEKLHRPIDQAIGVIKASPRQGAARQFVAFVLSDDGQALLERYGYRRPQAQPGGR